MARYAFLLAAIALFIAFLRLGSFTLFDVDEAVFAQASREMLTSGNWITPTYDGQNRFDKPILIYWLMAASYKVFGVNAFAARFPSAAAASLLALAIFFFAFSFLGGSDDYRRGPPGRGKRAFYAALTFVCSIFFLLYSHAAVTDMALTLFITLSLFSFYLAAKGRRGYIYGLYFFSALAFLTKGLIGVVFPFGIAFIYMLLAPSGFTERFPDNRARRVARLWSPGGFLLFLAVGLPWYIAEYMATGDAFIRDFFLKQHFARYLHVISGHTGPVYYYVPVLALGLFPWIAYLPQGVADAFRRKEGPGLFALLWLSFVVIFFSFARTKLPDYVLPAVPAAALLMGSGMSRACSIGPRMSKPGRVSNWFAALMALAMGAGLLLARGYLLKAGIHAGWLPWAAGLMFLMAVFAMSAAGSGRCLNLPIAFLVICFLAVAVFKAVPAASEYLQGTLYRYSIYAGENLPADGVLIGYKINNPSVVFYSGRRIEGAESESELLADLKGRKPALIISRTGDAGEVEAAGGPSLKVKLIASGRNYSLFKKE
ncbi:MAG: glycosyltransferase family 39 protein [Nitrospiraceae bacterium]|nr:glycosyltransferase family 39 protein [Nitrospiraceae bacterium]